RRAARSREAGVAPPLEARRVVLLLPDLLAVGRRQAADDLVATLAGEDVELVADQGGRGDAVAHGDRPFLRQVLRPGLRRGEPRCLAVAVGSAPLRPVLGKDAARAEQHHPGHKYTYRRIRGLHGDSHWVAGLTPSR